MFLVINDACCIGCGSIRHCICVDEPHDTDAQYRADLVHTLSTCHVVVAC